MIAPRLKPGDKIGIISPSDPVTEKLKKPFNRGIGELQRLGFDVEIGQYVHSKTYGYAASPREKAADINHLLADPVVKALLCSQGGNTANSCLEYIDWPVLEKNPKIIMGLSDNSVVLNAALTRTGLITFHGPDLIWGFGKEVTDYDRDEFIQRLVKGEIGKINSSGRVEVVREGRGEGPLIGGNLRGFMRLAGTPYFPDHRPCVLLFEALGITPSTCDNMFHQLRQIGIFERAKGVLIGYVHALDSQSGNALKGDALKMEDVLLRVTEEYDFPIMKVDFFGHNCPNTVLPVGARVNMDTDKREVEILEPCVE